MADSAYTLRALTRLEAEDVASWRYPAPYDIYDMIREGADSTATVELLVNPDLRYYSVFDEANNLVAFRCFGRDARVPGGDYSADALDMGGGLHPDLMGRGLGRRIIAAAMAFAVQQFRPVRFRTTVAAFNMRARRVCESLGYIKQAEFTRPSDGRAFVVFTREIGPLPPEL